MPMHRTGRGGGRRVWRAQCRADPRFDSGGAVSEALSWMDEKVDRARGQAVQSADAAITRFANQYLEEHQSDLGCPPDLLRAIRSWEEGEPLPNFLFDLPPAATLTEAERERGRRLCARRCPLAAIATDGAPGACRRCTTIFTIKCNLAWTARRPATRSRPLILRCLSQLGL